jgi:hypothetical protein
VPVTASSPFVRRIVLATLVVASAFALIAAGSATAARSHRSARKHHVARVPFGFFGTVLGDPVFPEMAQDPEFGNQLDLMVSSGVEGVRVVFDWAAAQPYQSSSQIPSDSTQPFTSDGVDSVPTDFSALDALVGQAAARGLRVLPVVVSAPSWDGTNYPNGALRIPRRNGPYANFCKALVLRYGPHGTFWKTHSPALPITSWQIWNEPNVPAFWPPQPFAARYVALLRAAHTAIRKADPHARIVLAGLANYSWTALRSIYRIRGAHKLFDIVGMHPYTKTPQGVIEILSLARGVMRAAGDARKPMLADEISWPSSLGKTDHNTGYDFATTESGQARNLAAVLPMLAADRVKLGLIGVYYYTWATQEVRNGLAFDFAGLLKQDTSDSGFTAKPALKAYQRAALALERCHAKGSTANVCLKPY